MKGIGEACKPGECRIQMFDLNGKETGSLGVPGMNPADGFLLRAADDRRTWHILLDAGKKGQGTAVIVPWLRQAGISRLDAIVLSHFHYDHFGGIIDLLGDPELHVEEIIYAPIDEEFIERGDAGELNSSLWQECRQAMEASGCRCAEGAAAWESELFGQAGQLCGIGKHCYESASQPSAGAGSELCSERVPQVFAIMGSQETDAAGTILAGLA